MENAQADFDRRWTVAREQADQELLQIRALDQELVSSSLLVRKAILMQIENSDEGTAEEVEHTLLLALDRDPKNVEAYIELGHFYYSVQDDSLRGKNILLEGIKTLENLTSQLIEGLLLCEKELNPDKDEHSVRLEYKALVLSGERDPLKDRVNEDDRTEFESKPEVVHHNPRV